MQRFSVFLDRSAESDHPAEIVVVHDVPALVCEQCGEEYVDNDTAKKVEEKVKRALADGLKMGFIDFNTAA